MLSCSAHSDPRNVLPMVNKALAIFQHRQDFATAESICREAVDIDPQCDVGVATLAQLLLQQNKVHDAADMFAKSAEMARTEPELVNALTYENVRTLVTSESETMLTRCVRRRPLAPRLPSSRTTLSRLTEYVAVSPPSLSSALTDCICAPIARLEPDSIS